MTRIFIVCFFVFLGCGGNVLNSQEAASSNNVNANSNNNAASTVRADDEQVVAKVENSVIQNIVTFDYTKIRDVNFWNDSMQTALYIYFLENDNIDAALEFRSFLEALDLEIAQASEWGVNSFSSEYPRPYLINPVILVIDNSDWGARPLTHSAMEIITALYAKRPDLFFQGNRGYWGTSGDMYSRPPLIHAVQNGHINVIRFFVENVPDWKEMRSLGYWPIAQWIWWDIGLGGNLLSYLPEWGWDNRRMHNFLVEQGIEEYSDISGSPIYVNRSLESTNVWAEPSFNSEVIRRISRDEAIEAIKITTYKVDGRRWVYFSMNDGTKGWAPYSYNIEYESGI